MKPKTVKVFSKRKYLKSLFDLGGLDYMLDGLEKYTWINEAEGKTVKELEDMGYTILDSWVEKRKK